MFRRFISTCISITFIWSAVTPIPAQAKAAVDLPPSGTASLPVPGTMVSLSPKFDPILLKGLTVNPKDPFAFDFIVDPGQNRVSADNPSLKEETNTLIKYFLTALTVPEKNLWVNLSPYEKDRMMADDLGQTQMGQDMLAQDYILKQLTASLIYPEKELGKMFWDKVYQKAQQMYGNTELPVNTFNKVWIVADKADVYRRGNTAYVVGAHLKVMLEEDYNALQKSGTAPDFRNTSTAAADIVREVILPELEKEVNSGRNFAPLRQMFYSMILASWYKKELKESLLTKVYGNQSKVGAGVNAIDVTEKEKIFKRYLQAYKKGVFNYVRDSETNVASERAGPRKYFAGGLDYAMLQTTIHTLNALPVGIVLPSNAMIASVQTSTYDNAMISPQEEHFLEIFKSLVTKREPVILLVEPGPISERYQLAAKLKETRFFTVETAETLATALDHLNRDKEIDRIGLVIVDHPEKLDELTSLNIKIPILLSPLDADVKGRLKDSPVHKYDLNEFIYQLHFVMENLAAYESRYVHRGYSMQAERELLETLTRGGLSKQAAQRITSTYLHNYFREFTDLGKGNHIVWLVEHKNLDLSINGVKYTVEIKDDGIRINNRHMDPQGYMNLNSIFFRYIGMGRLLVRHEYNEEINLIVSNSSSHPWEDEDGAMTAEEKSAAATKLQEIIALKMNTGWESKEFFGEMVLNTLLFTRPAVLDGQSIEDRMSLLLTRALGEIGDDNILATYPTIDKKTDAVILYLPNKPDEVSAHLKQIIDLLEKYKNEKEIKPEPTVQESLEKKVRRSLNLNFDESYAAYVTKKQKLRSLVKGPFQPLPNRIEVLTQTLNGIVEKIINGDAGDVYRLIVEAVNILSKSNTQEEENLYIYLLESRFTLEDTNFPTDQHLAYLKNRFGKASRIGKLANDAGLKISDRAMSSDEISMSLTEILVAKMHLKEWTIERVFKFEREIKMIGAVVLKASEEEMYDLLKEAVKKADIENLILRPEEDQVLLLVPQGTFEKDIETYMHDIISKIPFKEEKKKSKAGQWSQAEHIIDFFLEQAKDFSAKSKRDSQARLVLMDPQTLPIDIDKEEAARLMIYLVDQAVDIFQHNPSLRNAQGQIVLAGSAHSKPLVWDDFINYLREQKTRDWNIKLKRAANLFGAKKEEQDTLPVYFNRKVSFKRVRILDKNSKISFALDLMRQEQTLTISMEGVENIILSPINRSAKLWDLPFNVVWTENRYILFRSQGKEVFYIDEDPELAETTAKQPAQPFHRARFLSNLRAAIQSAQKKDTPHVREVPSFLRDALKALGEGDRKKEALAQYLNESLEFAIKTYQQPTSFRVGKLAEMLSSSNPKLKSLLSKLHLKLDAAQRAQDDETTPGGIDLDSSKMTMNVGGDEPIAFDPSKFIDAKDFTGLEFHIKSLTPADLPVLLGL
jgi:hypothetical protein